MTGTTRNQLVVVGACLALTTGGAEAGGLNVTWGTGCWQDNPSALQTFSCDSNVGSTSFVISFSPSQNLQDYGGAVALFDIQSDSPSLPDWWQLTDPGGCRAGALSATVDYAATGGGCADPYAGLSPGIGSVHWATSDFPESTWPPVTAPDRAHLALSWGVDGFVTLSEGTEYYGCTVTINHQQTAGAGSCAGCSTPLTIVLNEVQLYSRILDVLHSPIDNMCLRWQADGTTPCAATPVQNRTWGQVKSLYR